MIRKRLFVGFWENINDWSNRGNMFQRLTNDDSLLIIRDTDKVVVSPDMRTQIDVNDKIQVASIDDDLGKEFCKWIAAKISSQSESTTIIFFLGIDAIDERRGTNYREEFSKRISKAYEIRNASKFSKVNRINEQIVGVDELKNRRKEQMDRDYPQKTFSEFNSENADAKDSLEIDELFDGNSENSSVSKEKQAKIVQEYLQSQSTKSKSKKNTSFPKQNNEQQKTVTSQKQSNDETTSEKTDKDSESKQINNTDKQNQDQIATQSFNDEKTEGKSKLNSQDSEESKEISDDTVKLPSQDELNQAAREREEQKRQIARKKDLEIQTLEKKILNQDLFEEEISKTTSDLDDSKAEVVYYTVVEFVQEAEALYPKQIKSLALSEDLEKAFVFISQLSKTTNAENFKNSWKSYSGGTEIIFDEPAFQYLKRKADEFLFLCDALFR